MIKKIFMFILVMTITMSITDVFALESNDYYQNLNNQKEVLIQNKINDFLNLKNKSDVYSLTRDEEKELVVNIQNYKQELDPTIEPYWFNPWEYATTYDIAGYVFVSLDSSSSGWNYGHAGIGHSSGGNVIEANPGDGVKLYTNRVNSYWSKCQSGGVYEINNASSSDYMTARDYAVNKIGRGYGFGPIDGDFYCSELVYYAWDDAGYNIASSRVWGTLILPSHIMNDGDTILKASFPF